MKVQKHYIGGKARQPRQKPPVMQFQPLTCDCGVIHNIVINPGMELAIVPCKCGALLRYWPGKQYATVEVVDDVTQQN
jgi:hypothetical protein